MKLKYSYIIYVLSTDEKYAMISYSSYKLRVKRINKGILNCLQNRSSYPVYGRILFAHSILKAIHLSDCVLRNLAF